MPHKQDMPIAYIPEGSPEHIFAHLFNRSQPHFPVTETVLCLEKKTMALKELAGEMLATITVEGNAHLFADFPDDWNAWVDVWQKRYNELTKD